MQGLMLRRTALSQCGVYNPVFNWMQDVELWLRFSQYHRLANMREALYTARARGSQRRRRCTWASRVASRGIGYSRKLSYENDRQMDWSASSRLTSPLLSHSRAVSRHR